MEIPQVLALPLDEAARRLEAAGCSYEVQPLLPPPFPHSLMQQIPARRPPLGIKRMTSLSSAPAVPVFLPASSPRKKAQMLSFWKNFPFQAAILWLAEAA